MPTTLALVRGHVYVDSVSLLQLTAEVLGRPGVQDAALVMATDLNRDVLRDSGLLVDQAAQAGPNDLVIAVRGADEASTRTALAHAEALLGRRRPVTAGGAAAAVARSLRSAHRADPDARLAVISVPGPYAAGEARMALADGLHVFLFSDNVSIEDEVDLKRMARDRNLLMMGPDCGTAILNGVGLGFANVIRRGTIGIVGASGTGIQEVASLVHRAGLGISHAIGTGSRDLSADVSGITTLAALDLLREDPSTQTVMLVSKPSDPRVADDVLAALAATAKPAVAYLQGAQVTYPKGVQQAATLAEAAALATGASEVRSAATVAGGRRVRGLFCGGTLCTEAKALVGPRGEFIDFGDDRYTRGRAHPMIDPTLRNQAIVEAGRDASVGVLLLDFILGYGSHADPAGAALGAISDAMAIAATGGRDLAVVAHVVGTDQDRQGLQLQEAKLRDAGIRVCESNAAAARTAAAC